ncbi:MAG: 4'-phosphopantetheinyl transferase superfamily protein [Butyricicoccus sp.]|nr:4'-phosphopantetheinyl transferase superfamily protein [Butyricicoccus sp.]
MKKVSIFALPIDGVLQCSEYPIAPSRLLELKRIIRPEARARSLAAELLLCWAVRYMQPAHVPIPPLRSYLPQGKPYFRENPDFAFSLSHAEEWAVLAVGDTPLGIDLEKLGKGGAPIVSRFFHEQEKEFFHSLAPSQQADAFCKFWVLKESVVKALGTGMHFPFSQFAVSLQPTLLVCGLEHPAQLFLHPFSEGYRLGGCVLTNEPVSSSLRMLTLDEVLK